MQSVKDFQLALYEEMLSHIQETDMSVPYRDGDWLYYTRTFKGLQYAIHCRKVSRRAMPEVMILDVNELAKGKPFMSLGRVERQSG